MIKRGVIAPSFVVSYSHTEQDIEVTWPALPRSKRMDNKQAAAEVDEILDKTWVADAGMLDMTRM